MKRFGKSSNGGGATQKLVDGDMDDSSCGNPIHNNNKDNSPRRRKPFRFLTTTTTTRGDRVTTTGSSSHYYNDVFLSPPLEPTGPFPALPAVDPLLVEMDVSEAEATSSDDEDAEEDQSLSLLGDSSGHGMAMMKALDDHYTEGDDYDDDEDDDVEDYSEVSLGNDKKVSKMSLLHASHSSLAASDQFDNKHYHLSPTKLPPSSPSKAGRFPLQNSIISKRTSIQRRLSASPKPREHNDNMRDKGVFEVSPSSPAAAILSPRHWRRKIGEAVASTSSPSPLQGRVGVRQNSFQKMDSRGDNDNDEMEIFLARMSPYKQQLRSFKKNNRNKINRSHIRMESVDDDVDVDDSPTSPVMTNIMPSSESATLDESNGIIEMMKFEATDMPCFEPDGDENVGLQIKFPDLDCDGNDDDDDAAQDDSVDGCGNDEEEEDEEMDDLAIVGMNRHAGERLQFKLSTLQPASPRRTSLSGTEKFTSKISRGANSPKNNETAMLRFTEDLVDLAETDESLIELPHNPTKRRNALNRLNRLKEKVTKKLTNSEVASRESKNFDSSSDAPKATTECEPSSSKKSMPRWVKNIARSVPPLSPLKGPRGGSIGMKLQRLDSMEETIDKPYLVGWFDLESRIGGEEPTDSETVESSNATDSRKIESIGAYSGMSALGGDEDGVILTGLEGVLNESSKKSDSDSDSDDNLAVKFDALEFNPFGATDGIRWVRSESGYVQHLEICFENQQVQ